MRASTAFSSDGFVLHSYPYKETSLIVEAFTRSHGRVAMVAKGAKRGGGSKYALGAFQPISVEWFGRADMKTLRTADHQRIYPQLRGAALMAGFYLNELILKLVQKDDPHEGLFDAYALAIESLAQLSPVVARDLEATLRGFELTLLEELGYGLTLTHEADSDTQIDPTATYHYALERGPVRIDDASAQRAAELGALAGRTLLALAQRELSDATVLVQAKQLMRRVISHHLGEKSLHTRLLVRELK